MKAIAAAAFLACALTSVTASAAERIRGDTGVGVVLGNPSGGTFKAWLDETRAVDAGLGYSGDVAFYGDLLWHAWSLFKQPPKGTLGGYAGVGLRLEPKDDTEFGIRVPAGLSYWVEGYPTEIFAEAVPVVRLTPGTDLAMDGGIGLRYYF